MQEGSTFGSKFDLKLWLKRGWQQGRLADMNSLSKRLPQTFTQALMVHGPVHKWVSLQLQEQSTEAFVNPIPSRVKAQFKA